MGVHNVEPGVHVPLVLHELLSSRTPKEYRVVAAQRPRHIPAMLASSDYSGDRMWHFIADGVSVPHIYAPSNSKHRTLWYTYEVGLWSGNSGTRPFYATPVTEGDPE